MQGELLKDALVRGALAAGLRRHLRPGSGWTAIGLAPLLAVTVTGTLAPASQVHAQQEDVLAFSIAAQPLDAALRAFAEQSRHQVLFEESALAGRTAVALQGRYTPREALERLLDGAGVRVNASRPGVFTLTATPPAPDAAADPTLTPVVVRAQQEADGRTEGSGSLAGASAQAGGKTNQRLREIPKSVTVLTNQEIEDKHVFYLTEAMEQVSGITVDPDSRIPVMYSRGFIVSNLQIDGGSAQAMSEGYGAGVDGLFGLPNMAAFDHVEVVRGADGLFSGNGEPGATVNLVRKRPTRERQFLWSLSAGSWDDYRASADLGGALNASGSVRGRLVAAWQDANSWFDTVYAKDRFLYGVLEADLGDRSLLTVGASYDDLEGSQYERSQTWRAGSRNGQFVRGARNTWNLPWSYYEQTTRQVFGKLEHRFSADWKLGASLTWQDQDGRDLYARRTWFNSDTGIGELVAWDGRTYNRQLMSDLNLSGAFELFGRRHDLLVGTDRRQSRGYWRSRYPQDEPITIDQDIARPDDAELAEWTGADFDAPVPEANRRLGYYASLRLHVAEPLKLIVGGRYSRHTSDDGEKSIGKFIPFGGLTYELGPEWTAYTSVAEIYQPLYRKVPVGVYNPDPDQITFKDDPTTGRNVELGVKGELHGGALQLAASLFHIRKRNVWVQDTDQGEVTIPGYGQTYMMKPAGKVTSRGVDLEAKGQLTPGWQLSAGYTYNITHDDGNDGQPLLGFVPRHSMKFWSTHQLPAAFAAWRVGAGARIQGDTDVQGGYTLVDASVDYRVNSALNLSLIVKNLTDKVYRSGTWDGPIYGLPRSFMLALRGGF